MQRNGSAPVAIGVRDSWSKSINEYPILSPKPAIPPCGKPMGLLYTGATCPSVPLLLLRPFLQRSHGGRWQGRVGAIPNPQPPKKE